MHVNLAYEKIPVRCKMFCKSGSWLVREVGVVVQREREMVRKLTAGGRRRADGRKREN